MSGIGDDVRLLILIGDDWGPLFLFLSSLNQLVARWEEGPNIVRRDKVLRKCTNGTDVSLESD